MAVALTEDAVPDLELPVAVVLRRPRGGEAPQQRVVVDLLRRAFDDDVEPDFHALLPVVSAQCAFRARLTPFCSSAPVQK